MTGFFASSKAGHDKEKVYVIIRDDAEYVWLADGRIRTYANPKKKKKKHIQIIKYFYKKELKASLEQGREVSDLEIRMALKEYEKGKK